MVAKYDAQDLPEERSVPQPIGPRHVLTCDADWPTQMGKSAYWQSAVDLFEGLASETWSRLGSASELESPFGEVTISQINMLDIRKSGNMLVRINSSTSKQESKLGFDFDLFIGSSQLRVWWRYCIQAKKLSRPRKNNWALTQTYKKLDYKVRNGLHQIDLLEKYAQVVRGIPLYCFYNYSFYPDSFLDDWHCGGPKAPPQFGCTVATLSTVRAALKTSRKSFHQLHADPQSLPWRCLIRCPRMTPGINSRHPLAMDDNNPRVYTDVPPLLDFISRNYSNQIDFPEFVINGQDLSTDPQLQEFYPADLEVLPKWVGIFEI